MRIWFVGLIVGCVNEQRACERWFSVQCACDGGDACLKSAEDIAADCEQYNAEDPTMTGEIWACEADLWSENCDYNAAYTECRL